METIKGLNGLKANLLKLDEYLDSRRDPEFSFALSLVEKGICFVVTKSDDSYKFYPSRFIGYTSNSMEAHIDNVHRDGRKTNFAISEILGNKPVSNPELDKCYQEYCQLLGFSANRTGAFGAERKYWELLFTNGLPIVLG